MKKIITMIITLALIFSLVACSSEKETPAVTPEDTPAPTTAATASEDTPAPTPESTPEPTPEPLPKYLTEFNDITSIEWTSGIRAGINLANTFDALNIGDDVLVYIGWSWFGDGTYEGTSVEEMETAWMHWSRSADCITTKELFDAYSAAGFNAVRIPVTWFKVCDDDYNIREDWMNRIEEVVGWAMENDMYVIINAHHDDHTSNDGGVLFKFYDKDMENTEKAFVKIWQQIADRFKDYSEKLAFEALNEPGKGSWWNDGWTGRDNSAGAIEQTINIKKIQQIFVDTIRASGGNNDKRILILQTPGATGVEYYQRDFEMPNDPANNKIIVSLHIYAPGEFAMDPMGAGFPNSRREWDRNLPRDTDVITKSLDLAHELFVSQGIGVIIGEMAAIDKDNVDARADWAEFYYSYAKSRGIPCFWWDTDTGNEQQLEDWGEPSMGLFDRATKKLIFPEIVDAIMRATG